MESFSFFFLKILASKAQKNVDQVLRFRVFEIETKLHLQVLNFDLEFWEKNFKTGHGVS